MNRLLPIITAAAMFTFAGVAQAEEASGRVQSADPATGTLMLEDGTIFTVDEGIAIETLQPGTEVTVSYEEENGTKRATSVLPAQ